MGPQHLLLGWVLGLAATAAGAQTDGGLRWRGGDHGQGLRPSGIDLRLGEVQASPIDRILGRMRSPGLDLRWAGRDGEPGELGLYGRLGTLDRPQALPLAGGDGGGLTYGVGLRWDFSSSGSAVFGWDSYDVRTARGERDLRATSLGLQWRY